VDELKVSIMAAMAPIWLGSLLGLFGQVEAGL
jgi:hypothetical protein